MPNWLIKSALHRAISLLPRSHTWNEMFQEHVTKSLDLGPGEFEKGLNTCKQALDELLRLNPSRSEKFTVFELGTGWYPTVPISFYLCGAAEIWSFDIAPLLRGKRLKTLLEYFCDYDQRGRLTQLLPRAVPARIARLHEVLKAMDALSPYALMERLHIHTLVRDARKTGLQPESVDLIFSYSVLEYIPLAVITSIMKELKRIARDAAVMVHHIDLFDQNCLFDKSISPLHFLRFSSARWKWLQSPLAPLNRLRIPDYRQAISEAGFEITREDNQRAPAEILRGMPLAPEFQKISEEDLLVLRSWVVCRSR